jgi:hypothetical protein
MSKQKKSVKPPPKPPIPPTVESIAGLHSPKQRKDMRENVLPHRWRKGQSGNPSGKRKGTVSLTTALKNVLAKGFNADKLALQIFNGAMAGDAALVKVVLDRVDGTVAQQLDAHLSGFVGGTAVPTQIVIEIPSNNREVIPASEVKALPQAPMVEAQIIKPLLASEITARSKAESQPEDHTPRQSELTAPLEPEPPPAKRERELTMSEQRALDAIEAGRFEAERIDRANARARERIKHNPDFGFTIPNNPLNGNTF